MGRNLGLANVRSTKILIKNAFRLQKSQTAADGNPNTDCTA